MKIILTEEDVKKIVIVYLKTLGGLAKESEYEATFSSYDKDFMLIHMLIQAVKPEEEN